MASPDRRLLDLLTPIFRDHAHRVEAILPPELRANWRGAASFALRLPGRKKLDHRDLLLRMAELDTDQPRPPRELATLALGDSQMMPGAGFDERPRVMLSDGSRPARKDLIGRLARDYGSQRRELLEEVATARRLSNRMRERIKRIKRDGIRVPPVKSAAKLSPSLMARLAAPSNSPGAPRITGYQVDAVRSAVRKAPRKP